MPTEATATRSIKQDVIDMIGRLPDDCTYEDIHYHLYVRQKIEQAVEKVGDGQGVSTEEVQRRSKEWLKSPGNHQP